MLVREVLQHTVCGIKAEERPSSQSLSLNIFFPVSHQSLNIQQEGSSACGPKWSIHSSRAAGSGPLFSSCDSIKGTLNLNRPTAPPLLLFSGYLSLSSTGGQDQNGGGVGVVGF